MFLNRHNRHTEWRKEAKKQRRKRIRQTLAKERTKNEVENVVFELDPNQLEAERFQEEEEQRQRQIANEKWLRIEAEAQEQWKVLQVRLQRLREERHKQNEQIRAEWVREQARLEAIKAAKEEERRQHDEKARMLRERLENFIENGGETPEELKVSHGTNPSRALCPFFDKTGACRFQDVCSRNHVKPGVSKTLLIPNFYAHYSLEQAGHEWGDSALEFESDETYTHFRNFFLDVLPELETFGRVCQVKVCCNKEPHLRGNVYIEYRATQEAVRAFRGLNGRWYGGRQLSVEFCTIRSWRTAICGLFFKKRCPKGNTCNFLHVFNNPKNMFSNADRDLHRTPPQSPPQRVSKGKRAERRNWRWSESPERLSIDEFTRKSEDASGKRRKKRSRSRSRSSSRKKHHKRKS